MKFEIDRDVFAAALARALGIASKEVFPILRNVLLKSEDETRIQVIATDLDLSLWTIMDARVERPGAMTIPVKEALGFARNFGDTRISVEHVADKALMTAGKSRRSLSSIRPEDFPAVESDKNKIPFIQCDKSILFRALSRIFYVVPPKADAFSLSGIFFHSPLPGKYRFISTDGHRLAYQYVEANAFPGLDVGKGIILPRKGVEEMLKALEEAGDAWVARDDRRFYLKTPDIVLSMQLLEAEYPDYEVIIPEERPISFAVDIEKFKRSLKSMGVFSGNYRPVRIAVTRGKLSLSVVNTELGEAEDELDIDYDGEEFTVHIGLKLLAAMAGNIGGESMVMEAVDHVHAVVCLEREDRSVLHLIMPMVV